MGPAPVVERAGGPAEGTLPVRNGDGRESREVGNCPTEAVRSCPTEAAAIAVVAIAVVAIAVVAIAVVATGAVRSCPTGAEVEIDHIRPTGDRSCCCNRRTAANPGTGFAALACTGSRRSCFPQDNCHPEAGRSEAVAYRPEAAAYRSEADWDHHIHRRASSGTETAWIRSSVGWRKSTSDLTSQFSLEVSYQTSDGAVTEFRT